MGYRLYFYIVDREILGAIQGANSLEEAIKIAHPSQDVEEEPYTSSYNIQGSYKGFEFGEIYAEEHKAIAGDFPKLKWFDNVDHDCVVGNQSMVLNAIKYAHQRIIKNLEEEVENPEQAVANSINRLRWSKEWLVNEDPEDPTLTGSWLYEHSIFNLMSLYKNTDWKTKTVIFAGW